jgi:hypothetical protein
MLRSIFIPSACLALLFGAGCKPCGCEEASLVGSEMPTKITFDDSILPFVDDKFTVTVNKADGTTDTLNGIYKETNDTIRFDADGAVPFLSFKSGEINKLECKKPSADQFTVTPPAPPGGGLPLPLTFVCTKG